jgi:hypothetical protein
MPDDKRSCVTCGATDLENQIAGYGPLTDVHIIMAEGEEGYANERRFVCNDHLIMMSLIFNGLGFSSHRHGGINNLEDVLCPGFRNMDDCPTPDNEEE